MTLIKKILKQQPDLKLVDLLPQSAILTIDNDSESVNRFKQYLNQKITGKFNRIEPILLSSNGSKQIAKGEIYLKLKPNISPQEVLFQFYEFRQRFIY